jgi:ketosteroid isomerase-like protein
MHLAVLAISLVLGASVPSPEPVVPAPQPTVQLPPELARVLTEYETAWQRRDAAALARLFADDAFVLPSGRPPIRGRAAIQQYYTGQGGPLALRAMAFAIDGSVGYIIGGFAGKPGDADSGKFTLTLRKGADGRWLIFSDMDSGNRQSR